MNTVIKTARKKKNINLSGKRCESKQPLSYEYYQVLLRVENAMVEAKVRIKTSYYDIKKKK